MNLLQHALEKLLNQKINFKPAGITTDTRTLQKDDVFFAIRGQRLDGHNFIREAFQKGASACIAEEYLSDPQMPVYKVKDSLKALVQLSAIYRDMLSAKVICIAGSNGKTTTKDMIFHILKDKGTVSAPKSFNNFIGLPLTILSANKDTRFLILEVGISKDEEMETLARVAKPDVAVITNIGREHLQGLHSLQNVLIEESKILDFISPNGIAVLNIDDFFLNKLFAEFSGRKISYGLNSTANYYAYDIYEDDDFLRFKVNGVVFTLNMLGRWNIYNALVAAVVCDYLGVGLQDSAKQLVDFKPQPLRMQKIQIGGITFIADCYNSNPESARLAILRFSEISSRSRKILILGDMLELGDHSPAMHHEIALLLRGLNNFDFVFCIGLESRLIWRELFSTTRIFHFQDVTSALPYIKRVLKKGDLVLLKASRGIGLEAILNQFND